MNLLMQPKLDEILAAQKSIKDSCVRTPLIPFPGDLNLETEGTKVRFYFGKFQFIFKSG